MKNFLLFNQSFGTEGSPNQTGETLTRENRIGLMSYLRRTLMLLFAVLVMSMANVGLAWGANQSYDLTGTSSSISSNACTQIGNAYVGRRGSSLSPNATYGIPTGGGNTAVVFEVTPTTAVIKLVFRNNQDSEKSGVMSLGDVTNDYYTACAGGTLGSLPSADQTCNIYYAKNSSKTEDSEFIFTTSVSAGKYAVWVSSTINSSIYLKRIEVLDVSLISNTVTYNANGASTGTVPTDASSYGYGASVTVKGNTGSLAKDGYLFVGWNTASDGSGTTYTPASTLSMGLSNVTLYAHWMKYASTLDFSAIVTAGTTGSNAIGTFLAGGNMVAYNLGGSSWETSTSKSGFLGYKLANAGAVVKFYVQAGSTVTITLGSIADDVTLSKNGSTSTIDANKGDSKETVVTPFTPANDMLVTLTTSANGTVTLKKIEITAASSCSDDTGLAYGETTVNKTYGDGSFTNTLTNSNSLSVTYSSSNTDVATVNESTGAVTIAGAGTTTITATWAGNASYCEDEVTYTLNVKPSAVVTATETNGWRYTIGEKIDLTCTATGGSSYTYQWQKYTGPDTWTNLSNGTDGGTFSGVTTNRLQISGCTSSNGGSYRCVVTANDQTKESNAYVVYIFTLDGNYDDDSWTQNAIVWTGANTGRATINLAASRTYKFKVTNNDGKWFGCNTGVTIDMSNWTFRTNEGHCVLTTGGYGGGAYTFDIDISYAGDNNITVSVTYPKKTTYLQLCSDWKAASAKYAIYYWKSSYNGWTDFMTAFACDGDVLSADVPVWATNCIIGRFNTSKVSTGNWDDKWNQTGDLTLPTDGKDYYHTLSKGGDNNYYGSWGTYSPSTYTITFAGNGNTDGSMSSISSIACDADQQITANAFEKTGYTFANWTANVDVKVGGATVSAGSAIANSATIQNVSSDIALTAQWTEDKHSVTVEAGSNGTVSPSSVSNIGIATASGDITATANTGYHFTSWTLPSGTSAASTYSESSNPIRINATADGKTITANFSANTPTITLDDQDATNTPTGSVVATYGSSMPEIATLPTKTGYTFGGFYSDVAGGGTKYYNADGSSAKNSDLASATTLYALWTQSVTIDDNGGSADGSVSVTYKGSAAAAPSGMTYAGHTADLGFYTESSCTNKVMNLDGTLVSDVTVSTVPWTNASSKWVHAGSSTLYAHWKCNTPEISCSSNTITISVPSGATVYYTTTTDGSTPADPTSSSTAYNPSSKPTISADTKIKAIAIQSGCTNSAIASANLTYVAAGTSYYLFTPTSAPNPVHTGTLKGDFITDKSVGDGTAQTIDGNEFSKKSITIAGSTLSGSISGKKAGNYSIDYDVKTTSTTFYVYVSGANTSIYMHKIRESGYTTDSIVSQSTGASTGVKLTFTLKSKENTRVCFSTGSTSVRCYQIVAVESGDALPQACDEGYELNFNSGRYAYLAGSSNQMTGSIDGLDICSNNSYLYKNSTALELTKNSSDTYISFTTGASACAVKVTFSAGTLILNTSKSTSGGVGLTSNTAANLSASTTYYIINTNTTNRASITKIAFEETAAATYTLTNTVSPSGYGTVSHASVSSIPSGTSTSSSSNTYTVNGTTVTATPAATTAEYTYAFDSWSDLPATVAADAIVTANFTRTANSYTLTWNTNGGSDLDCDDCTSGSTAYGASITAPNDPTLSNYTFDGWKTNNDGTGSAAEATMPAANTTYYAAWKQTVTLNTGSQGSGSNQTPVVYLNGTSVSDFTPHTASGYTLQGYYTAGSGGVKVLNADGSFAAANVTDYITSSKWSRTGAAPTLYAQWVAAEDCHTLKYVWKVTGNFCDDQSTATTAVSMITTNDYFTLSGSNYSQESGASLNVGKSAGNYFLLTAKSGYEIKSVCIYGKIQDSKAYKTTDNSDWSGEITSTNTGGDAYYSLEDLNSTYFGMKSYGSSGFWIRNMVIEICAAGGVVYNVTYDDNDATGGTAPTDNTDYDYGDAVTVKGNTGSLVKTNYTFAGWSTNNDGTGSSYVADNTFSITANTTLYAKWTQAVTFDANTANHGSTGGSATAVWNATGLTGITHATPASGYKLLGYYTAATAGTKVLNSDGSFAATAVDGYVTDGKWSRTDAAATLYAQYESAGALTWNLIVNSDTTNLSTSTKTSAFTEISTTNMTDAALTGLKYSKGKKSSLTGKIETKASYNASEYVSVSFQVASGYKFIPSSVKVIAQPVTTGKNVKLALSDNASPSNHSLVMASDSAIGGGTKKTVTLAGDGSTYFTGTVTLKIYCYGATDAYRLGTPITIEGEVEEACATMPSFTRLSFGETSYKVGDTPDDLEVVGGTNITTYAWKQNTVNDRSGGDDADGDNDGSSYTPSTSSAGTMYYWCEMTNSTCGITIKTSAVGITVNEVKTNPTITWDTKAKYDNTDTTAYYGGKNYTLKATLNSGWNGTLTSEMFTAPTGIRLHDFTIDNENNPKTITATFDVLTTFDVDGNDSIAFTLSLPATTTYNALSSEKKVAYNECSGAGEGSSYNLRMRKTVTKDGNYYHCANTDGWVSPNISSSYSTGKAGTKMATDFDTVASSNTQYVWVRTYHANVNKVRIYADFRANDMTVSNVYKHTAYFSADSKYAVDYTAVYNGDEENENTGTAAQGYVDITLDEVMAANDILLVKFNDNKVRPLGAVITEGSAGSLNTHLQWSGLADKATVAKYTTDAYFTYSASMITENTNSLGDLTYSSSDPSVATVDATGKVALIAAGSTTIKATLAASGCYKKAEISYTLNVTEEECAIAAGTLTLTSGTESKCSSANVTLTLTGFESGADIQWKDGDTNINDGGNYTIVTDKTTRTSTLTTNQEGTYSVIVTKGCFVRSNRITISNKSTSVSAERDVKTWYIKKGRLTPPIELWSLSEGTHLSSVAWSPANATGLSGEDLFFEQDDKVYMQGTAPTADNSTGSDIAYTLTLTVKDECNNTTTLSASDKQITLYHQKNTDKHVLAFVVNGTEKGGFTEGLTAAQTTDVPLYKTIATNFDVQATNCYASDDEKKVKEYYSQYDILCITDYPNSNKTGVNKKKYVDVLGKLIDVRPILTMEAFVSDKANWKAKGISGSPKDPTTRQYTMLLQCKDHEIFSRTNLVKVGEGDETMYRVTMVEKDSDMYKTLDATYGAGAHEASKGYKYHDYPALQGFTFSDEMLEDGLLPLGLIDDGAGNDLQVGIERQAEMSARLMVLGVNSYAMERLTPDGQKVIINALNYLMKKNEEEIADCSITFIGGDETKPNDWNTEANWKGGQIPDKTTREIRILAPVVITSEQNIHAQAPIKIASSGTYNDGADNATGKITIEAGGVLRVDGKITGVTAPAYSKIQATKVTDIILNTSSTAQSALIMDNEEGLTRATVNLYSLGRKPSSYQYQYFAVPMEVVPVNPTFANETHGGTGIYTYVYSEATSGWTRRRYYDDLFAFEGLGITTKSATAMEYEMTGTLTSTATKEITLTHDGAGLNLVGNSWMAPIQIGALAEDNTDANITKTVYIYCAGRDAVGGAVVSSDDTETAGQWLAIPFEAAEFETWKGTGKLSVIPAMQAFQIKVSAEATLTLDYKKVVRGSTNDLNAKLRAPGRRMAANEVTMTNIRVADSKTHTDLSLFEGDRFSEAFDNGWEAEYMNGDGRSAKLYAETEAGQMAVAAMYDYEGTVVGFAPGQETEYTFSFMGEDNGYYLNDIKLQNSVRISEGETYTFTYEEGDAANRFYISRTAINAPEVATGMENLDAAAPRVQKIIYNDKLYIIRGGRLYDATGKIVK